MAANPSDIWVCSACRSLNAKRAGTCYRCRAPRELTGASPATLATVGSEHVPAAIHPYRSARVRALLVSVALIATHVATTAVVLWIWPQWTQTASSAASTRTFPEAPWVAASWLAMALILTTAWAAWISRVVDNLPALGVGYARSSPRVAFLECFVVGPNVVRAPALLGQVIRRLDARGWGFGMFAASWLAVFGPPGLFAVYFRFSRWVLSFPELRREMQAVVPVFWVGATVGIVLAITVIARVERLSRERYDAARAAGPAC